MVDIKYKMNWVPQAKELRDRLTAKENVGIASKIDEDTDDDFYQNMYEALSKYFSSDEDADKVLIPEKVDRDGVTTEVIKSYNDIMKYYGKTGMLSREGVDVEVDKVLGDPRMLEIPTKTFDDTEEVLSVEEVSNIASDAIDSTSNADEVQPTDGKVIDLNKELDNILVSEGGFQNDKDDSGNYVNGILIGTNKGITPAALAEHRGVKASSITVEDIKNLTEQEARDIFKEEYFYKPKIDELPTELQASVFDMQINSGSNAIKILQKLVGTKQDGIIGPKTLQALEDNTVSVNEYAEARIEYYNKVVKNSPEKKKFLSGWTNRANSYRE